MTARYENVSADHSSSEVSPCTPPRNSDGTLADVDPGPAFVVNDIDWPTPRANLFGSPAAANHAPPPSRTPLQSLFSLRKESQSHPHYPPPALQNSDSTGTPQPDIEPISDGEQSSKALRFQTMAERSLASFRSGAVLQYPLTQPLPVLGSPHISCRQDMEVESTQPMDALLTEADHLCFDLTSERPTEPTEAALPAHSPFESPASDSPPISGNPLRSPPVGFSGSMTGSAVMGPGEPSGFEMELSKAFRRIVDLERQLERARVSLPVGRSVEIELAEMEAMDWRERLAGLNKKLSARSRYTLNPSSSSNACILRNLSHKAQGSRHNSST